MKRQIITLLLASGFVLGAQAKGSVKSGAGAPRHRGQEIPILAWYSIVGKENATLERYRELRECGFTYTFSHTYTKEDALLALDLAAKTGMKSIFMCPELEQEPEATVKQVRKHRGLGGYFLRDEPQSPDFDDLAKWARRIESVDTKHPCYLNLLPNVWGEDIYRGHLKDFNRVVNLPQVSFDHYPVHQRQDGSIVLSDRFYMNLELIAEAAKEAGKPFWAFALSTAHGHYPIPTMAHLRLQMYSNLAYGAQALQYFTYWSPGTETWDFHDAPITHNGKRSRVYELVREMNQEIQRRSFVFLGAEVEQVCHLGDNLPWGTKPMGALPTHFTELDTHGAPALVSTLKKGDKVYVVVQNTSPTEDLPIRIQTDDAVLRVRPDGTSAKASLYEPDYLITPGNVEIFGF